MRKYKVSTVGVFCDGTVNPNGQVVRTSLVTDALAREYGDARVNRVSYKSWKKRPLRLLIDLIRAIAESENLLVFPDKNAIKVLAPFALAVCRLFGTKLHYNVLGGWLPTFTEKKKFYRGVLRRFDTLFVQTAFLRDSLCAQGFENAVIFPNFKPIEVIESQPKDFSEPYRCFFLSRVMREKGIEDLIEAVREVNRDGVKFALDIFGPFDHNYEAEFSALAKEFPDCIRYMGCLEPNEACKTIHPYFLQIFPTKYKTEGFPGCVIDSFAAGVPVLASRWQSFDDVIREGETGMSYRFASKSDLIEKLNEIYENPRKIIDMREKCTREMQRFLPEHVIKRMTERF